MTVSGRPSWLDLSAPVDAWPTEKPEVVELRARAEVEPARLFELARAADSSLFPGHSANTRRCYESDWAGFVATCNQMGVCPLPASPATLQAFIELSLPYSAEVLYRYVLPDAPRRNVKVSTVERALAAIGAVHAWLHYPNPVAHPDVADTFKINARGRRAKTSKNPLPYSTIERALASYGHTLSELRAKALATMAFSTLLRRCELVALVVADFQPSADTDDGVVRVHMSGADESGPGSERRVSPEARVHLEAWLRAADISSGPIFRRLTRAGVLKSTMARGLHPGEVARILKDLAKRGGCDEREVRRIAGNSTRLGATRALAESGVSFTQLQEAGGWLSPVMPAAYLRKYQAKDGDAE